MRRISCSVSPAAMGSKSASAAICDRKPEGSKKVIFRVAVLPAVMVSQNCSRLPPPGATPPTPVTTVRRKLPLLRVHVPEGRLGGERAHMEDHEDLLVALVAQAVAHVHRDHHRLAGGDGVGLVVEVGGDRPA